MKHYYGGPESHSHPDGPTLQSLTIKQHAHFDKINEGQWSDNANNKGLIGTINAG